MNATEFKAKCLGVLDDVRKDGAEVIITKRGKPVARLVPVAPVRKTMRGIWKGRGGSSAISFTTTARIYSTC